LPRGLLAPRLLAPVQPEAFARAAITGSGGAGALTSGNFLLEAASLTGAALEGARYVLVVEQSHGAQFHRYLRAHYELPGEVRVFHRPGPLPIRAGEIHQEIRNWSA